jgi:glycosyltransferase involved in cell wall biosynthesis
MTGSERYVHNIFSNLGHVGPENEYTIYTKHDVYNAGDLAENSRERVFRLKSDMVLSDFLQRGTPEIDLFHMTWFGENFIDLLPLCLSPTSVLTVLDLMLFRYPSYFLDDAEHEDYQRHCRLAIDMADVIIAISNHTKSDILSNFNTEPAKVKVVPLGVDDRFCTLKERNPIEKVKARYGLKKPYLFYVATDYPHKNHDRLITAFLSLLKERKISVQLVLAGARYYSQRNPESQDTADSLQSANDLVWLEHIRDDELNALYNGADMFIYPSLDEGFGLPILEAMACGTPVAASNAASIPEVTGDAALLFDPTDISDIANSIETLLNDQQLRRKLVERGYRRCSELTWEESVKKTLAVYSEAMEIRKSKHHPSLSANPYFQEMVREIVRAHMALEEKCADMAEALELKEKHLELVMGARSLRYYRKIRELLRRIIGL